MSGNETDTVCYLGGVDFCAVRDEHQSVSDDNVDAEYMRIVGYILFERPDSQVLSLEGGSNDNRVESLGRERSENGSAERLEKRSDVAIPAMPSSKNLTGLTANSNSISLSIKNTTSPLNADDLQLFIKAVG